jgi:nitroreductase
MEVLDAIDARASAVRLGEPGPRPEHLDRILKAGARAPDHGRLSPWRFIVIERVARDILGRSMAEARLRKEPPPSEQELAREREKALRAPTIVAVAAKITPNEKVPEIEQIIAAGVAVQNMFLAAQALGYGAMWKTGAPAYDLGVKKALGLNPGDHVVAFLYLGTPLATAPARPADIASVVRRL